MKHLIPNRIFAILYVSICYFRWKSCLDFYTHLIIASQFNLNRFFKSESNQETVPSLNILDINVQKMTKLKNSRYNTWNLYLVHHRQPPCEEYI